MVEAKAARVEHNPTAALGFEPVPSDSLQIASLRDAPGGLEPEGRSELFALMCVGQGDLAVQEFHRGSVRQIGLETKSLQLRSWRMPICTITS